MSLEKPMLTPVSFELVHMISADGTAHTFEQQRESAIQDIDANLGVDPAKRQAKMLKNRKMVTSARRTLIIGAKVMVLFAAAAIYFAVSFSLEYKEFNRQYVSMAEQAYAARRNTLLGDSGVSIRDFQFAAFRPSIFRPLAFASAGGRLLNAACAVSGL